MARKITIRRMGERAKQVTITGNMTVKKILEEAGLELSDGTKVIANGTPMKAGSKIGKFNELLLVPTVKGGS